ncbi:unnamed protein product [Symbiodinium sp. CCMP2592]|nr:unnamed protein product [Symbiodinium sp. CCMP2592]
MELNIEDDMDFGLGAAAAASANVPDSSNPFAIKLRPQKHTRPKDEDLPRVPEEDEAAVAAINTFLFCKVCKRDVQACKADAEKDGRLADWARLTKTAEGLRHLVLHYQKTCPSRGQGVRRDSFDWASYTKKVFTVKQCVTGTLKSYMDWIDYEKHALSKGLTPKDAMDQWQVDYIREETITGQKEEISHSSKVKKGKEAEQLLEGCASMIRRAKDAADGFDMQPFNFAKTASAVEAALESSAEKNGGLGWEASSEAQLDLDNLSVAESTLGKLVQPAREMLVKGVKRRMTGAVNALQTSAESLEQHESLKGQFGHVFAIVQVRRALLDALTKKSNKDFQEHVESLDAKSLSFQPMPRAVLVRTHVLEQLQDALERIMQKETKEEIENLCSCLTQQCAIRIQLRNSLKNTTRDVENAIKADVKKKERDAEAPAKKAAKTRQTADTASAAAARKATATAKDSEKGVTILSTFFEKLKFTWFPRFGDLSKFKAKIGEAMESKAAGADPTALHPLVAAAAKVATGSMPFVISSVPDIEKLVKESPRLRCMVTNFGHQFSGTQLCKVTGRVQCPMKKANAVLAEPVYKDLEPLVFQASLFGFTSEVSYVGFEKRGLGQLQYVLQGSRRVITASPRAVMERMGGQGNAASWVTDMIKLHVCGDAGSIMYIPLGWLIAEEVQNGEKVVASGSASCRSVKMNA